LEFFLFTLWSFFLAIGLMSLGLTALVAVSQGKSIRTLRKRIIALEKAGKDSASPATHPATSALKTEDAPEPLEPEPLEPEPLEPETLEPEPLEPETPEQPQGSDTPVSLPLSSRVNITPEQVAVWIAASLGGLALVLTALFALVAVVERGWISPAARVSAGLVTGIAAWTLGIWRQSDHPWASASLSGTGVAMLYGSLYAASGFYTLFPATLSAALMVTVTAVATLRAAKSNQRFMAYIALIGGLLTPVLVSTGTAQPVTYFAYLALLAAGIVAAAVYRRWWDVVAAAAIGTGLLHVSWTATWYAADQTPYGLMGAFILALPFALASTSRHHRVHLASILGGVMLSLLALPWLVPIDPVFLDPQTGETVVRTSPEAAAWGALAIAFLPVPLWLAARRQTPVASSWPGAVVATALPLVYALGWVGVAGPPNDGRCTRCDRAVRSPARRGTGSSPRCRQRPHERRALWPGHMPPGPSRARPGALKPLGMDARPGADGCLNTSVFRLSTG
jgi:hypothetical protein